MRRILAALAVLAALTVPAAADPLTVKDYVAHGVPAPDHKWTAIDYNAAYLALSTLGAQLPRSSDPGQAALVDRMANPENIEACGDSTSTPLVRVRTCAEMMLALVPVARLYAVQAKQDPTYNEELTRLAGYALQVMPVFVEAVQGVQPPDKSDPSYDRRMAALQSARDNCAGALLGAIPMFAEPSVSDATRAHLAKIIADGVPRIAGFIPPDKLAALRAALAKLAASDRSPAVRAALASFAARP